GWAGVWRGCSAPPPGGPPPADAWAGLPAARSRYGEVEAAVRDVRRRLERGESPERLAIIVRDLSLYGDLVGDVCRRYGGPVYFRKGKPLLANRLVNPCPHVVRRVLEGCPRARLESLLDADHFAAVPHGLGRVLRRAGFVAETARPLAECIAHRAGTLLPDASRCGRRSDASRCGRRSVDRRAAFADAGARLGELLDVLRPL